MNPLELINHTLNGNMTKEGLTKDLEAIAENVLSGIGRNYYLTVAQELRAEVNNDKVKSEID